MNDLIDRKTAIDAMFAEMPGLTFGGVLRVLRGLPSAEQWIPCSEKLPRKRGHYIVSKKDGTVAVVGYEGGIFLQRNIPIFPVAWMPLPEPYKQEQEKEKTK